MFYDCFVRICKERGFKPTNVISELGMSSGNISRWKNGVEPRGSVIAKFADYFNVPLHYFSGETPDAENAQKEYYLSDIEKALIDAFRATDAKGKLRIAQFCMNELDAAEARRVKEEGAV